MVRAHCLVCQNVSRMVCHHDHAADDNPLAARFPVQITCYRRNTFEGAITRALGLTGRWSFSADEIAEILARDPHQTLLRAWHAAWTGRPWS